METPRYKNYHVLQKNRLIKLKETSGRCEICNKVARIVHHADFTTDNHQLENLTPLCGTCHRTIHSEELPRVVSRSKYRQKYGLTLCEMALRFGGTKSRYGELEKQNKLGEFLLEHKNL